MSFVPLSLSLLSLNQCYNCILVNRSVQHTKIGIAAPTQKEVILYENNVPLGCELLYFQVFPHKQSQFANHLTNQSFVFWKEFLDKIDLFPADFWHNLKLDFKVNPSYLTSLLYICYTWTFSQLLKVDKNKFWCSRMWCVCKCNFSLEWSRQAWWHGPLKVG